MVRRPHQVLALSGGLGLAPLAPGTMGALGGVGLFVVLQGLPLPARGLIYAVLIWLGMWAATRTGADLTDADHSAIVFDETIGMCIALEAAPLTAVGVLTTFVLFRVFDIWKPWPIYLADRGRGAGVSVILDDLLAALWTMASISALALLDLF